MTVKTTYLSKSTTIEDYAHLEKDRNRVAIAKFIRERFLERYFQPLQIDDGRKHGFCTMAICCLLIEALESFWSGWSDTKKLSRDAFESFFCRCQKLKPPLGALYQYSDAFYENVRCGILHQAETRNGWRIRRIGKVFDESEKIINATEFLNELSRILLAYCTRLEAAEWNDELWRNFRKKMKAIIKNCKSADISQGDQNSVQYFAYGSNMLFSRLRSRAGSANKIGVGQLKDYRVVFNKQSADGSAKANLLHSSGDQTWGVLYRIARADLRKLDRAEKDYSRMSVSVIGPNGKTMDAITYVSNKIARVQQPLSCYKQLVISGAQENDLPQAYVSYLKSISSLDGEGLRPNLCLGFNRRG